MPDIDLNTQINEIGKLNGTYSPSVLKYRGITQEAISRAVGSGLLKSHPTTQMLTTVPHHIRPHKLREALNDKLNPGQRVAVLDPDSKQLQPRQVVSDNGGGANDVVVVDPENPDRTERVDAEALAVSSEEGEEDTPPLPNEDEDEETSTLGESPLSEGSFNADGSYNTSDDEAIEFEEFDFDDSEESDEDENEDSVAESYLNESIIKCNGQISDSGIKRPDAAYSFAKLVGVTFPDGATAKRALPALTPPGFKGEWWVTDKPSWPENNAPEQRKALVRITDEKDFNLLHKHFLAMGADLKKKGGPFCTRFVLFVDIPDAQKERQLHLKFPRGASRRGGPSRKRSDTQLGLFKEDVSQLVNRLI